MTESEILEQDPTMPQVPEVLVVAPTEDVVAPIEPVVAPTPVLEEKRHSYQPTDEHGRALGGPQVIVYKTQDELVQKMTENSIQLIRKLRSVSRDARLGKTIEDIPTDVDRLPVTVQFHEKPLTAEERYSIAQDMNDPSKFDSARDRLFESALGTTPAQMRDAFNQQQLQTQQLVARQNAQECMSLHPEYYGNDKPFFGENINTIVDWMVKNGLQPTVKNFELAHSKMNEAGLLLSSPIVREVQPAPVPPVPVAEMVPKPQVPVVEPVRLNEEPVPQEKRQAHVPSSLNNRVASNSGEMTPSATAALTLEVIERMSSEQYRKNLSNPAFVKRVNELEAARPPRPRR
jgi:hypothetical protein